MTDVVAGAVSAQLEWVDAAGLVNFLQFDVVVSEDWDDGTTVTEHPVEKGADVADHVRVKLVTCQLKVRSSNEPIDANNYDQAVVAPLALNVPTPSWVPGPGIVIVPTWTNPIELRALAGSLVGLVAGPVGGVAGGLLAGALAPGFETDIPTATDAGLLPPAPTLPPTPTVQQWPLGIDYVEKTHALLVQLKNSAQLINVFGTKQTQYDMVIETLIFHRGDDTGTGEDVTLGLKEVRIVSTQTVPAPIPNLSAGGGKPTVNHGAQDPTAPKKSVAVQGVNAIKGAVTTAINALGRL